MDAGGTAIPVSRHQARNTDRRAQGNSARPSGQDPSSQVVYGFVHPRCADVTGSPPPLSPTSPGGTNLGPDAAAAQPIATGTVKKIHAARPVPDEMANLMRLKWCVHFYTGYSFGEIVPPDQPSRT